MNPFGPRVLLATVVYGLLGGFMLVGLFWIIDRLVPTDIWRGIVEEKSVARSRRAAAGPLARRDR